MDENRCIDNNDVILEGQVKKVIFKKEDWIVFVLETDDMEVCVTGNAEFIEEEDFITVKGIWVKHKQYGRQIKADSIIKVLPNKERDIEKYLIKNVYGVGEKTARTIVKQYGLDTFKVIAENPEKLINLAKISEKRAKKIAEQLEKLNMSREEQMFFIKLGISDRQIAKIKKIYKDEYQQKIMEDPFQLIEDIEGIGFEKADEIRSIIGIPSDSPYRIKAGILYFLENLSQMKGHVYYQKKDFIELVSSELKVSDEQIEDKLTQLSMEHKIVIEMERVYLSKYYNMEVKCANILKQMIENTGKCKRENIEDEVREIEKENGKELDESQRSAVIKAIENDVMIITGGPGVGKTTTLDIVIKYLQKYVTDEITLLAPTGRAAKRMSEQTGMEAATIHRTVGMGTTDEVEQIETDVIIVDEMSMVDINIFGMLLNKVIIGTKLIMVGDVDQIPSVGPGLILRDLIDSGKIEVAELTKIHRQAEENHIVTNAHKINKSEMIELNGKNKDFFFVRKEDECRAMDMLLNLYTDIFPRNLNLKPTDIQILTPIRRGMFGTIELNRTIQATVNPKDDEKKEIERFNTLFREGDKVMNTKNNYGMKWINEKENDKGYGVFNGEVGFIQEIDTENETVKVLFDDGKLAEYEYDDLSNLMLAYAITIHKSQGSEYPVVVLPLLYGGVPTLYNKNLLYTAVTRAKTSLAIIGREEVIYNMVRNKSAEKRYTSLNERLVEGI